METEISGVQYTMNRETFYVEQVDNGMRSEQRLQSPCVRSANKNYPESFVKGAVRVVKRTSLANN